MKCDHFDIEELAPPEVIAVRGELAWELFDTKLLTTLDQLRDYFGPLIVNNWRDGGQYKESGLRWETSTGARFSQHRFGRAADIKPKNVTPQEMYTAILSNSAKFPFLTTLEDIAATPTWLHVDCRNNHQAGVRIVKP